MDWRILVCYPEPEAKDKIFDFKKFDVHVAYSEWCSLIEPQSNRF
jgi:hypothetical protein